MCAAVAPPLSKPLNAQAEDAPFGRRRQPERHLHYLAGRPELQRKCKEDRNRQQNDDDGNVRRVPL